MFEFCLHQKEIYWHFDLIVKNNHLEWMPGVSTPIISIKDKKGINFFGGKKGLY